MNLLDDARRLLTHRPILGGSRLRSAPDGRCYYCGENWKQEPHAPGCPWLSLPKIVAVLEAADAIVNPKELDAFNGAGPGLVLVDEPLYRALVAVMKESEASTTPD